MTMARSDDEVEQEIYRLRARAKELSDQISEREEEARKAADARDELHEKMKQIKEVVRSLKEERQALLEQIRVLRAEIRDLRQRLFTVVLEAKNLRGELRSLKVPPDINNIKRRLEEIDLYLASHRVRKDEEKRFFEEAMKLEAILQEYEKALKLQDKISSLSPSVEALKGELDAKKAELDKLSTRHKEVSKEMERLNQEYNEYKVKADEHHALYIKMKESKSQLEAEHILVASRLYELQKLIRGSREALARQKAKLLREKMRREAQEKLSRGEKLDFEELKILLEDEPNWFGSSK